jgi:hypothetical protein
VGVLFTLKEAYNGRSPTGREWAAVARYNQLLFQLLTEAQRRRFLVGGISPRVASWPVLFAAAALISLLGSIVANAFFGPHTFFGQVPLVACYLIWLMSLGAIGSLAFIGMNALSVQQDITFDLLNPKLINLRVALGALFALVLTLPFGFDGFVKFIGNLAGENLVSGSDALMLILPFLLGFSTSLVIMVLNRMLEAAQSFFGRTIVTTVSTAAAPKVSSPSRGKPSNGPKARVRRKRAPARPGEA